MAILLGLSGLSYSQYTTPGFGSAAVKGDLSARSPPAGGSGLSVVGGSLFVVQKLRNNRQPALRDKPKFEALIKISLQDYSVLPVLTK